VPEAAPQKLMLLSKSVEIRQSKTASRPTIRRSPICVFTQPPPIAEIQTGHYPPSVEPDPLRRCSPLRPPSARNAVADAVRHAAVFGGRMSPTMYKTCAGVAPPLRRTKFNPAHMLERAAPALAVERAKCLRCQCDSLASDSPAANIPS